MSAPEGSAAVSGGSAMRPHAGSSPSRGGRGGTVLATTFTEARIRATNTIPTQPSLEGEGL